MFNKKKIFGTLMAIMLSAGISFGNNNCEAYAQRWERLLSSTIDILLDRDIEPPYMHGYAFVEPQAAIFMPPRMERRMGILGALAEFVEMLPPPLPPEPTIVVVRHHRPLPRHLRPLRKFEHFHHPVRNIHKPAIVRGRVVPHKVRHKDLAVLHKPRTNRPIAPHKLKAVAAPHKPPMMKKAAAPRKPMVKKAAAPRKPMVKKAAAPRKPMVKKAAAPRKPMVKKAAAPRKPMVKKAAAPRKPMVKKAAAPRKPMVKKPVTLRKPIKSSKISRPQSKPQYRKPSSSYKRPQPKSQYRKPSSSYKRPQPKPQYRKSSSGGSKRPANNNEQYWQKKRH